MDLWSTGRHVRSLKLALVIAVLVVAGCLVGLPYGPEGVAAGFSAAMVLWLLPHIVWCLHGTTITPLDLLRTTSGPLFSALVAVTLAYAVHAYFGSSLTPFFRLVLAGTVMAAAYSCLMTCAMGKDFYLDLFRAMRNTPPLPSSNPERNSYSSVLPR